MAVSVKRIQQALIDLGYDLGPAGADGVRGRRTLAAIVQFQHDRSLDIMYPGTVGPKTLAALGLSDEGGGEDPPWVSEVRRRIGLHEKTDNKTLRDWLDDDGRTLGDPAKLPWCGDLVETPIVLTLPAEPMIENPYYALNWQKFGVAVPDGMVPLGAIATFERRNSAGKLVGGHVGFVVGHDSTHYHILGGNQSNRISIARIAKSRQKGTLRWPLTYAPPTETLPETTISATVTTNEA